MAEPEMDDTAKAPLVTDAPEAARTSPKLTTPRRCPWALTPPKLR